MMHDPKAGLSPSNPVGSVPKLLLVDTLVIDIPARQVLLLGQSIDLTSLEFNVLLYLVRRQNCPVSR